MIENIKSQVDLISNQIRFIELVKSKPAIFNLEQSKLEEFLKTNKLKQIDDSYDYLLRMPIYSLTKEVFEKLKADFLEKKEEIKIMEATEPKEMYVDDLNELKRKFK